MKSEPYCLVLGGGGAKGVFHIGVWRALKEMKVPVNAFIGNSIGAVVAGFLAQEEYDNLDNLGEKIGIGGVINIPKDFLKDGEVFLNLDNVSGFKKFYKSAISDKGLDTSPWRKMIYSNLDEKTIRKKGHDLGVVAFNLTDMEPEEIFIDNMKEGDVLEYLIASSAIPGFQLPEIEGKTYVDGGVYDNIPYTMARKRGYKRIIISDLSGLGVTRKLNVIGCDTIYIKNSIDMGGVLDFNRDFMKQYNLLGYLDTKRTFGALEGIRYYIKPDKRLEKKFRNAVLQDSGKVDEYFRNRSDQYDGQTRAAVQDLLPPKQRYNINWLMVMADCTAAVLGVERIKQWDYKSLFKELKEKRAEHDIVFRKLEDWNLKELEKLIKKGFSEGPMKQSPYLYHKFLQQSNFKVAHKVLHPLLFEKFPELPSAAFFLDVMQDFWS